MKSTLAKTGRVDQKWWVVDATDAILGRMASKIAVVLMGKHKPIYTPHVDTGDFVIVLNADKVRLTGTRQQTKEYQTYSRYPGGQKSIPYERMLEKRPERIVELAVKRMLPKNKLGREMFKKLKVYRGGEHSHTAQKPEKMEL